jgi:hypothetical protein
MKALLPALLLSLSSLTHAQVAITSDGSQPDPSAMLDIKSTSRGLLLPRMTQAQRNAISLPATGIIIYQVDNSPGHYTNTGTSGSPSWQKLGALALPYAGSNSGVTTAFAITNSGQGHAISGIASSTTGNLLTGVYGESASNFGIGVDGNTTYPGAGLKMGVRGIGRTDGAIGVYGLNNSETGVTYGVRGTVFSPDGYSGYFTGGKFYVEGNVGIGTSAPSRVLTIKTTSGISSANFVNDASGATSIDGLMIGLTGTLSASIMNYENAPLVLGTNNTSRLAIMANGDVGINTLVPVYNLDVAGDVNLNKGIATGIALRVNGDEALWYNNTYFSWGYGGTYNVFSDPVGINCAPGEGHMLAVNGIASKPGGGTWAAFSDGRLKDIHGPYTRGLDAITRLEPVSYNYKKDNPLQLPSTPEYIGFVAQDVQKIFPETIMATASGYLEFDMHAVNVALVNAVKDLNTKLTGVQAENQELKTRLEALEKLLVTKTNQ